MQSIALMTTAFQQTGDLWRPAGHDAGMRWISAFHTLAPWLFLALVLLLLVQAWRNRRHYRAVETLHAEAVGGLRSAVAKAEGQTVGEIGVVVLERSDRHPQAPFLGAIVLTALATLAFAHHMEGVPLPLILGGQLVFGVLSYASIGALPDLRRRFVSSTRAAEMADEQAIQEFHALGLRETEGRTGVLLFVSLFERRVVVLADEGIASSVEPDVWIEVDAAILGSARKDQLEEGLLSGVSLVGAILKERFPADSGGDNQVIDHVIVRRE